MDIRVTTEAIEFLQERLGSEEATIEIQHDTDGCGCVVSGVARLIQREKVDEGMDVLSTNIENITFVIHPQVKVFFDEQLIIDSSNGKLQLKSPNEMLNPRLKFVALTR